MSIVPLNNRNLARLVELLGGAPGPKELETLLTAASQRRLRLFANACCRRVISTSAEPEVPRAIAHSEEIAEGAGRQPWLADVPRTFDTLIAGVDVAVGFHLTQNQLTAADVAAVAVHTHRKGDPDEERVQAALLRDVLVNPFHTTDFPPEWRTDTAVAVARQLYESRDFSPMPILADALQDAGCDNPDVLDHCRNPDQGHVRGCWVVDLVLGKN